MVVRPASPPGSCQETGAATVTRFLVGESRQSLLISCVETIYLMSRSLELVVKLFWVVCAGGRGRDVTEAESAEADRIC